MERSKILYNRAVYESKRDGLPMNLREDNIASMLFEAEKVRGIPQNEARIRPIDPCNGYMYGNVEVVYA